MTSHRAGQAPPVKTAAIVRCLRLVNRRLSSAGARVVLEKELPVYINGEHLVTASISPGMEKEFVTGYLFGQGFIDSADEVASVALADDGARVTMKDAPKMLEKTRHADYRIVSGGGKAAFSGDISFRHITSDMKIGKSEIFKAMNAVFDTAGLYQKTEGVHATGLFTPEAVPVCLAEDIGRHNTLDKVIGYALLNNVDCGRIFLATTGRLASEMVAKICRAGIPVAATKTAITGAGRDTGERYGLTIIGFVRDTGNRINTDMEVRTIIEAGMKIYTGAERIIL